MPFVDLIIVILATAVTFGLYSILTGISNPYFAWAEHTYIGGAIGLTVVVSMDYIRRNIIDRVSADPVHNWPLIISLILGLMMLTRIHPRYSYIARIPVAVATATGVAVSTRAVIFTGIIKQIQATILPILNGGDPKTVFTNIMVILFVIIMMTYFIYTMELKGPIKTSYQLGRYLLYAAFGVLFAMTYMGRLGLLLGRLETLLFPVTHLYITVIISLFMVVTIYLLHRYYPKLLDKLTPE